MIPQAVVLGIGWLGVSTILRALTFDETTATGGLRDEFHPLSPIRQVRSPAHPTLEMAFTYGRYGGYPRLRRPRGLPTPGMPNGPTRSRTPRGGA